MRAPTRPVLRYHGGKWRLAPWIISHFAAVRCAEAGDGGGGAMMWVWVPLAAWDQVRGRCASDGCAGMPTHRLEAGGVGSQYCADCKAQIEARIRSLAGDTREDTGR